MDARDLYDGMLREHIVPRLRALGFRGTKTTFYLTNPKRDHAGLGFQKWRYSNSARCRFTINLSFHTADLWRSARDTFPSLPPRPNPNSHYLLSRHRDVEGVDGVRDGWEKRIGYLLDDAHDHWWTITRTDDVPPIADHVNEVIAQRVIPQLSTRIAGVEPLPLPPPSSTHGANCPWHCYPANW